MNEIKNKADELYCFYENYPLSIAWKKQCAQFVCEENIKEAFGNGLKDRFDFWQQVKTYIENNY